MDHSLEGTSGTHPAAWVHSATVFASQSSSSSHTRTQRPTQTYRLSPQTEEGIKAAVTSAMPEPSPRITRWTIYKTIARWVSLTICAAIAVGETFAAIFDRGYIDTVFGISWVSVTTFEEVPRKAYCVLTAAAGRTDWRLGRLACCKITQTLSYRIGIRAAYWRRGPHRGVWSFSICWFYVLHQHQLLASGPLKRQHTGARHIHPDVCLCLPPIGQMLFR
jgi:hypothetical protein